MIGIALALAAAVHHENGVRVFGYTDQASCAHWTEEAGRHGGQNAGWVMGFISGANAFSLPSGGARNGVDAATVLAWMDQYCAAHPLDAIVTAAFQLAKELRAREP